MCKHQVNNTNFSYQWVMDDVISDGTVAINVISSLTH